MFVREATAGDVEAACEVLEAAFRRPDEARLFRALADSDELALALVAIGVPPRDIEPGETVVAEPEGHAGGAPARAPDRTHGAGGSEQDNDARITGVAVLSHLLAPGGAVALGPLAVRPECSDRGIGKALVAECVERARAAGNAAIFVLGRPPYYTRFGFSVEAARPFHSEYPAEFMLALELKDGALSGGGELRYPPAFAGL